MPPASADATPCRRIRSSSARPTRWSAGVAEPSAGCALSSSSVSRTAPERRTGLSTCCWAERKAGPMSASSSSANRARTVAKTDNASACRPAAARATMRLAWTGSWNGAIDAASRSRASTRSGWSSVIATSVAATHVSKNSRSSTAKRGLVLVP